MLKAVKRFLKKYVVKIRLGDKEKALKKAGNIRLVLKNINLTENTYTSRFFLAIQEWGQKIIAIAETSWHLCS